MRYRLGAQASREARYLVRRQPPIRPVHYQAGSAGTDLGVTFIPMTMLVATPDPPEDRAYWLTRFLADLQHLLRLSR